jgi:hypothetical protein
VVTYPIFALDAAETLGPLTISGNIFGACFLDPTPSTAMYGVLVMESNIAGIEMIFNDFYGEKYSKHLTFSSPSPFLPHPHLPHSPFLLTLLPGTLNSPALEVTSMVNFTDINFTNNTLTIANRNPFL